MDTYPLRILIDGECPLCVTEARFLSWLDRGRGRLVMEDIAAEGFDPSRYRVTMDEVMGAIHAIDAHGSMVVGMEVFRRAYRAVGLGWTIAWTGWWPFRPLVDAFYRWFARNRMMLTGRGAECESGRCGVTRDHPAARGSDLSAHPADR